MGGQKKNRLYCLESYDDQQVNYDPEEETTETLYMDSSDGDDIVLDSFLPVVMDADGAYRKDLMRFLEIWHTSGIIEGENYGIAQMKAIYALAENIVDNGGRTTFHVGTGIYISMDYALNVLAENSTSFDLTFHLVFQGAMMKIDYIEVTPDDRIHFSIAEADVSFLYPGLYLDWQDMMRRIGDERRI